MTDEFKRGVKAAAGIAGDYDSATTLPSRLEDLILCKLNVIKREKPRKNKKALMAPALCLTQGMVLALAEVHRLSGASSAVRDVARDAGLTLEEAREAGCDVYDIRELRKAGVARGSSEISRTLSKLR